MRQRRLAKKCINYCYSRIRGIYRTDDPKDCIYSEAEKKVIDKRRSKNKAAKLSKKRNR